MDGDSDMSRSFTLFSDDEGMIRFNVNPREESDEVATFAVDCASDGQSRTFGLELRPSPTPSLDMPAPAAEIRAPKATDVIRPALTRAEAPQFRRRIRRAAGEWNSPATESALPQAIAVTPGRSRPRRGAHSSVVSMVLT